MLNAQNVSAHNSIFARILEFCAFVNDFEREKEKLDSGSFGS